MKDTVHIQAPAKLNLFLHINSRRSDGYHHIQTLFQPIRWYDHIKITRRSDAEIKIHMHTAIVRTAAFDLSALPVKDNLIYKAGRLLQKYANTHLGADIYVDKNIPAGAGLGGGSSDAAATLLALNQLWQLDLSRSHLAVLAEQLGADVPVMLHQTSALAEGKGEKVFPVLLPELWFLVLMPHCHCDTRTVFQQQQLTRSSQIMTISDLKEHVEADISVLSGLRNDCQDTVRMIYPEVDQLLHQAESLVVDAFSKPKITGTGSAVFMMFSHMQQARKAGRYFREKHAAHNLLDIKVVASHTSTPYEWDVAKR